MITGAAAPAFTTGLKLIFGMPIEELVFFIGANLWAVDLRGRRSGARPSAAKIKVVVAELVDSSQGSSAQSSTGGRW